MRTTFVFFIVLCLTGCKENSNERSVRAVPPDQTPNRLSAQQFINLSSITRPVPTTPTQRATEISRIWKGRPASPQGGPASMTSWNINVSNGTVVLKEVLGSEAELYLGGAGDVFFRGSQSFADFAIHPTNATEPNMQIQTTGSPTKSLLFDCSIGGFNPNVPPTFQFEQFYQTVLLNQWTNKSIVTPSAGHVFYGISPVDWPNGSSRYTTIRLQPTPDSPGNVWQFFGCELTFVP